ncbi:MAG: cell envelope integrity protein CreD [Pseudomonas sp.]|uniref:cell envelope integrity protein CreD n=1 Tax=Pseudomonas sp. TaxID=306 RepID=UPI003396DEED
MNRNLLLKLGAIALLMLVLMIPILLIDGVIEERQGLRDQVLQDIARSSSYSQQLTGPLIVVPYRKTVREWTFDEASKQRVLQERQLSGRLYFLPETFVLNGEVSTEVRKRGIYQARLYHANNAISGHFELPVHFGIEEGYADYRFEQPLLAFGISDIRGIGNALKLRLNGNSLNFQPGTQAPVLGNGVHAPLPGLSGVEAVRLDYALDLSLQGSEQFSVTPVGRDSRVSLKSSWPHPSFSGEFLPVKHSIDDQGFTADWQTSFFATNLEEVLQSCAADGEQCAAFGSRSFGVGFIDPVDQYLKSDRAIKYALLFIGLTFAGFFLFEVLKRLSVHPIQYGLVGLSLALFYLLLLSLAEHLDFALAYGLSAAGCVCLIGFYVSHVLHSWSRGLGFTAALAALYGLLYGLLSAEDYALLMGSLLVFGLLTCVMVLTRKLDWYGIGKADAA